MTHIPRMSLAEYLRSKSITQAQFAKLIGATQGQVSRYATGDAIPRANIMAKIREVTGGVVTADSFYKSSEAA